MGHKCCSKQKVKRGLWSPEEDEKLINHITTHGHGSWSSIPKLSGLQRCGKSCRLRWINYLKPDVKRGSFTAEEEQIIIDVHRILGNRWAQIAKHLPGRTDNEVKNFWNSCIKKKLLSQGLDPKTHNLIPQHKRLNYSSNNNSNNNNILQPFTVTTVTSNDPPVMEVTTNPHELLKLANPSNVPWTGNSTTQVYQQPTVENGDRVGENNKVWSVHNNINIESFEVARVADIMKPNAQEKDIYDEHDNNNKSHGLEMDALFDLEFMESTLLCGENLMSSMDDLAWNF
ncbi:hypothetical protein ACFE04_023341 [Oxalis oulophora]